MGNPSKPFQSSRVVKEAIRKFGGSEEQACFSLRMCDDVPRFIKKLYAAHRQTANSQLRFGPSPAELMRGAP